MNLQTIHGLRVLMLPNEGPSYQSANDLLGLAWEHEATMIALPAERLDASFFTLSSGVAGELAQKLVNYKIRLAILGDISAYTAQRKSLRDFVYESNRGSQLWFLRDEAQLIERLGGR